MRTTRAGTSLSWWSGGQWYVRGTAAIPLGKVKSRPGRTGSQGDLQATLRAKHIDCS